MAILIKPVQRINPQDPEAAKKWYIVQVSTGQADETEVAMDIADETTLNGSEAMMAIRQLRKIVLRRLLSGESVAIGGWGSFNITLSSTGADSKEQLTAKNIKSVNINFQPDEAFKAELQKARFAWVDKLAAGRGGTTNENDDDAPSTDDGADTRGDGGTSGGEGGGEESMD